MHFTPAEFEFIETVRKTSFANPMVANLLKVGEGFKYCVIYRVRTAHHGFQKGVNVFAGLFLSDDLVST